MPFCGIGVISTIMCDLDYISKSMFQPNIWLANFLLAEYPDEYPAGWYLVI